MSRLNLSNVYDCWLLFIKFLDFKNFEFYFLKKICFCTCYFKKEPKSYPSTLRPFERSCSKQGSPNWITGSANILSLIWELFSSQSPVVHNSTLKHLFVDARSKFQINWTNLQSFYFLQRFTLAERISHYHISSKATL